MAMRFSWKTVSDVTHFIYAGQYKLAVHMRKSAAVAVVREQRERDT